MYIIKNISNYDVNIDGIIIPPKEYKTFSAIKNRLRLNRFINTHSVNIKYVSDSSISDNVIDKSDTSSDNAFISDITACNDDSITILPDTNNADTSEINTITEDVGDSIENTKPTIKKYTKRQSVKKTVVDVDNKINEIDEQEDNSLKGDNQ